MPSITQGKTNLTYLLIVIVLAVIVGGGILGYYYSWIKDLEIKLAKIESGSSEAKPSVKEGFDPAKIETVFTFYDSNGTKKKIMIYDTWAENFDKVLYLIDEDLNKDSAVKIIDLALQNIISLPNISPGEGMKYIVIELLGMGGSNILIMDEDGELITFSLEGTNHQLFEEIKKMEIGWGQHGVGFKEWVFKEGVGFTNEFIITIGLASDNVYEATIDATTGKAISGPKKVKP